MRSFWIIQVNPKFNSTCPSKRQREIQRREGDVKMEAEMSFVVAAEKRPKRQESVSYASLPKESGPADTLILAAGLQNRQRLAFFCFRP